MQLDAEYRLIGRNRFEGEVKAVVQQDFPDQGESYSLSVFFGTVEWAEQQVTICVGNPWSVINDL